MNESGFMVLAQCTERRRRAVLNRFYTKIDHAAIGGSLISSRRRDCCVAGGRRIRRVRGSRDRSWSTSSNLVEIFIDERDGSSQSPGKTVLRRIPSSCGASFSKPIVRAERTNRPLVRARARRCTRGPIALVSAKLFMQVVADRAGGDLGDESGAPDDVALLVDLDSPAVRAG